jgi:iron complex transport system permease protein
VFASCRQRVRAYGARAWRASDEAESQDFALGLVAPRTARIPIGEDQRGFLPASPLLGALPPLASVASRSIMPGAIFPIGIITALIGAPLFVPLTVTNRRAYW